MFSLMRALLQQNPAELCALLAHQGGGIKKLSIRKKSRQFFIVSKPELLREVLITQVDAFDKGGPLYATIAKALGGEGLFTVNDSTLWEYLHSLMYPSLRRSQLEPVTELASSMWRDRMEQWDTSFHPIALFEEAKQFNMQLLAAYLFGLEIDSARLVELASEVFAGMAGRVFLPSWFPGGAKYQRAINAFMQEIDRIIALKKGMPGGKTLLDTLIDATPNLSDKQLRHQVVTLLMAGHDSTATVFSWALIRLSERPEAYNRLRRVALGTRGSSWDSHELFQDILNWLRAAAHEHPAFPLFFRNVAKQTQLGGETLKPGDQIIVAPHATHHDPAYWHGFDDFLSKISKPLEPEQRRAHLPFGQGARKCIGEDFAMRVGIIMLTELLRQFTRIERPSRNSGEKIRYAMTAPPRDGGLLWLSR